MSESLNTVKIPPDLGTRLRILDRLSQTPQTLDEYGALLQERIRKSLEEPGSREYFQEIFEGKKIFGHVKYETRHKVQLFGEGQVHVACALDALIEGFFQPIKIDSACFHCGKPVQVKMSKGIVSSIRPSSTVIWLGASKAGEGSCETYLCPYINFFSSARHIEKWRTKNPNELGIMLTLQQGLQLARKGYWKAIYWALTET